MQSRDEFLGMTVRGCEHMYRCLTGWRGPGTDSAHSSKSNCRQRVTLPMCKEILIFLNIFYSWLIEAVGVERMACQELHR